MNTGLETKNSKSMYSMLKTFDDYGFHVVVSVSDNGSELALIIADMLSCDFIEINEWDEYLRSKNRDGFFCDCPDVDRNLKILLVDDVSYNGKTLELAKNKFLHYDVKTFVLSGEADYSIPEDEDDFEVTGYVAAHVLFFKKLLFLIASFITLLLIVSKSLVDIKKHIPIHHFETPYLLGWLVGIASLVSASALVRRITSRTGAAVMMFIGVISIFYVINASDPEPSKKIAPENPAEMISEETDETVFQMKGIDLATPEVGDTFDSGDIIHIVANLHEKIKNIKKIEFFSNDRKIGEDINEPYSLMFNKAKAGVHKFRAEVVLNDGKSLASAEIPVMVLPK